VDLNPGVVTVIGIVAIAAAIVLMRWGRRGEAAAPVESPIIPSGGGMKRDDRDSSSLANWLFERAYEQTGFRVTDDPLARERIVQAAAKAMDELRSGGTATISLPFLTADATGPKHFVIDVKRNADSTFAVQR
jgi:hypothetical protein